MCGGTVGDLIGSHPRRGLSPRVRGNLRRARLARQLRGSIPACAGEPWPGPGLRFRKEVYPRVCGGTHAAGSQRDHREGLSPRVRGNLRAVNQAADRSGSIPACAGEPSIGRHRSRIPRVYPRVCGGTIVAYSERSSLSGLSPRVRGNLALLAEKREGPRSIPACAGEPSAASYWLGSPRVYPRVCGGTSKSGRTGGLGRGLSPRVRGNPGIQGAQHGR